MDMPFGAPAPSVSPREMGEDASAVLLHQVDFAAVGPLAGACRPDGGEVAIIDRRPGLDHDDRLGEPSCAAGVSSVMVLEMAGPLDGMSCVPQSPQNCLVSGLSA
jgi:hypothetical protein